MPVIPKEHVEDAHKLLADGIVELFEFTPAGGGATLRFRGDVTSVWLGNEYKGMPLQFSGVKRSASGQPSQPTLTLGDGSIDLGVFKPLLFDGDVDGGTMVYHKVLLQNLLDDRDIKETMSFRVKRPSSYNRLQIVLQLAAAADAMGFSVPFRQYAPPAFPAVRM